MNASVIAQSLDSEIELVVVPFGSDVDADALAVPVTRTGSIPEILGIDRDALQRAGFVADVGKAIAFPSTEKPVRVAVGIGSVEEFTTAKLRDAAAAYARSVPHDAVLATQVPATAAVSAQDAATAIVEGIVLARYQYSLKSERKGPVTVTSIHLIAPEGAQDEVEAGARRGLVNARAASLARDFAACPAGILTATRFGEIAEQLGSSFGLEVEVFDKAAVTELGLGGLLGVNKGSVEEPRMIVLKYRPEGEATGHLAFVGKGIMYDSGGINLKPGDVSHSQMKNDMTGAGNILAAMTSFSGRGVRAAVTGYLMCTDNMPSGSAMQLGDVLTIRGGTTVEVLNTDAEGRLVMADALALAVEEGVDAILDIATLTGQCLRTLGEDVAGVMSNSDEFAAQVETAAETVDEPVWRLPLIQRYRSELDSDIADIKNLGGINAGSITAGLFLEEFVSGVPWAHVDIAGTAQSSSARRWINRGPTGFGTRLLIELAESFQAPTNAG